MAWLAIGFGGLLLGLWLLRLFATARVETVKKAGAWSLGILGGVVLLVLLATGRGGQALWTLFLFGPMAWRWWQGRRAARRFGRDPGEVPPGEAAGDSSAVDTATLAMRLHHGSGRMTGRVRRGAYEGRDLADLGLPDLLALLADCRAADPDSVPLLEAWLDRVDAGWREAAPPPGATAPPPPGGPMTRQEALAVLGLAEGVAAEEIRAAHRRLMRGAHPDQGGSDWLAARINQARDVLLP
jgi:hypothetical protein